MVTGTTHLTWSRCGFRLAFWWDLLRREIRGLENESQSSYLISLSDRMQPFNYRVCSQMQFVILV